MERRESFIVGVFIAILVPVCLFFASWWLSIAVVPERYIFICAFGGLGLGVLLDAFFLAGWTARAYKFGLPTLAIIYIYVSVITYAVFMGVPVFNLLPGAVAGLYIGRRLRHDGVTGDAAARTIRGIGLFAAGVIACAAASSAFIALRDPYTGMDIGRMLHMRFSVTRSMLVGLIAVGGPALVACQYWLAAGIARFAYGR
ncbi:MAG: hypothetical protein PHD74_05880 [Candidatus Krumholzibacteria bacterium]|nr:hypothetical protein [Candidatus Krumholzibacteria bacterium]